MIAMALPANDPALLIADEPTTALDVTIEAQILQLLARLRKQRRFALLLITHDLQIVRRYADSVCVMKDGVVVEAGRVAEVFAAPSHPYTRMLLSAVPKGEPAPLPNDARTVLRADEVKVHFAIRRGVLRRPVGYVRAVDGVSITVREGQTVGLVGEFGSGRRRRWRSPHWGWNMLSGGLTSTARPIAALDRRALRRLRARMQIVFQDPFGSLSPRMPVGEIIAEGLRVPSPASAAPIAPPSDGRTGRGRIAG